MLHHNNERVIERPAMHRMAGMSDHSVQNVADTERKEKRINPTIK